MADRESARGDGTVLAKAMLVLDAFSEGSSSLSLARLVESSGLPKSTVHRVASTLTSHGFLTRRGTEYSLGLRLFELGALVPRSISLRSAAIPFMQDLFMATQETVNLAVLDQTDVVYVEKLHGHRRSTAASRVGGRVRVHCTALGKAILAFSPPSLVEEVVKAGLRPMTPYSIAVPDVLVGQLREVRQAGVAFEYEEAVRGFQCVSAPILDRERLAIAAVSVSVPRGRDVERLAPAVRTAAAGIARMLDSYGGATSLAEGEFVTGSGEG